MSPKRKTPHTEIADRLHSAAIRLLRRLRRVDDATGCRPPALSALSVVVFRGPLSLGDLAGAEQVRPPSMTRTVRELESLGLVRLVPGAEDRRVVLVRATPKGEKLLQQGRQRRVRLLAARIAQLPKSDLAALERALRVLEEIVPE